MSWKKSTRRSPAAKKKVAAFSRGGRIKGALDWGRKQQIAKDRKQVSEVDWDAIERNYPQAVAALESARSISEKIDLEIQAAPSAVALLEHFGDRKHGWVKCSSCGFKRFLHRDNVSPNGLCSKCTKSSGGTQEWLPHGKTERRAR